MHQQIVDAALGDANGGARDVAGAAEFGAEGKYVLTDRATGQRAVTALVGLDDVGQR